MSVVIYDTPWSRQPQFPAVLAKNSFTDELLGVFLGPQGRVNNVLTQNYSRVGSPSVITGVSRESLAASGVDTSNYWTSGSTTLPVGQWTIAAILAPTATPTVRDAYLGFAEAPGDVTFDRQLALHSITANFSAYLYDGAEKYADSGVAASVDAFVRIVGTTNGSTLYCYCENSVGSLAVNNSGFTGYASPEFLIGNPAGFGYSESFAVALCLVSAQYWPAEMARAWIDNPWQIFQPLPRRIWVPSAAAGITGPLIGARHLINSGALIGGRLAA